MPLSVISARRICPGRCVNCKWCEYAALYVHHLWNSGLGPSDDHSKAHWHVQFAQARLRPMVLPAEFFGVKDLNLTLFLGPGFLDWH